MRMRVSGAGAGVVEMVLLGEEVGVEHSRVENRGRVPVLCELMGVGMDVVVGGSGGEHLAVLVGSHGLGAPDVSLNRRMEREVLTVGNDEDARE